MNVDPTARTTLLCTTAWQAFSTCTARAAMKHLITGRVKGLDANHNVVTWDGSDLDSVYNTQTEESSLAWSTGNIALFPDHPYMRSAPNPTTGEETRRYIPTIAICTHHFGYKPKKGENVSLKALYGIYKGECQYCLKKIPFSEATKDHVFPKSHGGTNHDFNLVLACRKCNSEKDSIYPYLNAEGKEVVPRKMLNGVVITLENVREEWKPFLYLD